MGQKTILRAACSLAVLVAWNLLSLTGLAQVAMQDAGAFISDLPPGNLPPAGRLGPAAPQPQLMPSPVPPRTSAQPVNRQQSMPTPRGSFNIRLAQAPKMLGDFFGQPASQLCVDFDAGLNLPTQGSINQQFGQGVCFSIPNPSSLAGRLRLQDNNSALPQDRIFFDYSYFHNAQLVTAGAEVNRYTPGFERTFADGYASVEIRIPMAATLNSQFDLFNPGDASQYEFGNMSFITKFVLHEEQNWLLAGGLGVSVPTGDDLEISLGNFSPSNPLGNPTPFFKIANESVHLTPYLAAAYTPQGSTFFANAFLTLDIDTNGNTASADAGSGLQPIGTWNDQNLISLDLGIGSWLYKSQRRRDRLQGIAWTTELHYSATVNDADVIESDLFMFGMPDADLSLLNMTVGAHVQLGKTTFTAGYGTPLTSSDRVFDGELRLFVNRAF